MKHLLIAGLMAMSVNALAGDKGNGGDAVVCRDSRGEIISAELLDYYEGKNLRGLKYQAEVSDVRKFTEDKVNLIKVHDPKLGEALQEVVNSLVDASEKFGGLREQRIEEILFTSAELENIQDSEHLTFPRGCGVEQLAIRVDKKYPEDPAFIIQKDIWKKLPQIDKAGLILHEAIYKYYVDTYDEINSRNARYYNQMTSSLGMEEFNFTRYVTFANKAGIRQVKKEHRYILTSTLRAYSKEGLFIAEFKNFMKDEDQFVVMNKDGEVNVEETILSNPRSVKVKVWEYSAAMVVKISVNGDVVCNTKKYIDVERFEGTNLAPRFLYGCDFELTKGSYGLKVELLPTKRSVVRSLSVKQLGHDSYVYEDDFVVRKKQPYVIEQKITVE